MYSMRLRILDEPFLATNPHSSPRTRAHNMGAPVSALAKFYYLKNFQLVLSTFESRYSDLLLEDELRFIREFSELPLAPLASPYCHPTGDTGNTVRIPVRSATITKAVWPTTVASWIS
jgi:hypothetical protein